MRRTASRRIARTLNATSRSGRARRSTISAFSLLLLARALRHRSLDGAPLHGSGRSGRRGQSASRVVFPPALRTSPADPPRSSRSPRSSCRCSRPRSSSPCPSSTGRARRSRWCWPRSSAASSLRPALCIRRYRTRREQPGFVHAANRSPARARRKPQAGAHPRRAARRRACPAEPARRARRAASSRASAPSATRARSGGAKAPRLDGLLSRAWIKQVLLRPEADEILRQRKDLRHGRIRKSSATTSSTSSPNTSTPCARTPPTIPRLSPAAGLPRRGCAECHALAERQDDGQARLWSATAAQPGCPASSKMPARPGLLRAQNQDARLREPACPRGHR